MSVEWYTVDINSAKEGLNPLLPHIAGVIENMEVATISDIKNQIEKDTDENVSKADIITALDSGIKLGLFSMQREFKVCREFTAKDVQKSNKFDNAVVLRKTVGPLEVDKREKTLMDYVKLQREKRRRKMYKGRGLKHAMAAKEFSKSDVFSQLCNKCRKSIEKKLSRYGKGSDITSEESLECRRSSSASEDSDGSGMNSKTSENDRKLPQKSRLLVEKNPMETDPPYYDIFT